MSNVGEAASLFGSAESDSDIFGTVAWDEGSGSNHGTPAPAANGDMHVNPDVDALFGASSANGSLDQASWLSSDPHQNYDHNSSYSGLGDSHQQQSGLHDQWNTYDQSGMQAQEPYYGGQNYSNPPEAHQPYQPPAQQSYAAHNYASSVQTQNTYAPAISQTSNSYYNTPSSNDPYKPEPTPSSDYTPVAATASSTYDPYKPQDPPRAVPQSHSTYSYPSSDRGQTTSSTAAYKAPPVRSVVPPAPPEVTTAPYRPKVLTAYDPPLPPPKPKRFSGQPAFQGQSAYSSYALPKPTNVNVPPPASPAPPRSSSSSHFSSPNDAVLPPPPPARKFATPPAQHLPDGDGSHDYLQVNGYQYHSTLNDEVGQPEKPQHVATSPPSASRRDSTFGSNDYSQVSAAFGSTDQEFLEDPEGGNMDIPAADETPSLESDSSETLNSSWSTGTGTVTPRTAGEIDYEPSPTPSASLHTAENPDYEQSSPEEPTSIASPSAPETIPYDPYRPNGSKANAPPSHQETRSFYGHQTSLRTSSPVPVSSQVSHHETKQPLQDPFAPGNNKPVQAYDPYSPSSRMRSASNGSVLSSHTDPYGPSSHVRQQSNGSSEFGHYTSRYNYPDRPSSTASDRQGIQSATVSIPAYPSYAPSPSLLGTNDPLGRANVRIPVLSFGFGGKVVTCFHGASVLNTGFDVALSSRQSRDIHIRLLTNIVPQSALEESTASYPGPLFSEPGQLVGLVRPGASTQTKTKKAKVVKYLEERIEELSRVVAYTSSGQSEYGRAEGKLILVKLLKIMVENDSRLSGSPEIDASIRETLIPRLADSTDNVAERFSAPVDGLGGIVTGTEASLTVHSLKPSHLDRIQNLLLRGERRQAYHYALDEKLWAHAMVIASSLGKESWQEVANEFIRTELNIKEAKDDKGRNAELKRGVSSLPNGPSSGRESLRVAYSLYAGQGAAAVQALLPANSLVKMGEGLRIPPPAPSNLITSVSSSVPGTIPMPNIPPDVLSKWTETAAMMISSPMSPDTSSALTALGDQLASNQWIEAAHACYLLSPQTSLLGGVGTPSTRIVLLGSGSPHIATSFSKDSDAIIFSEIAEFALSLATPPKGQDHFCGLQYLQPYRLIRAHNLAEMGYVQLATRYCEAITSSLSRGSPYFSTTFFDQLTGLTDRLIAAPSLDKTGSWMGGKMTRPSLDKIGNWLEGRLTKFIAGEGDGSPIQEEHPFKARQSQGPFSHYSSISSAMHSADPSPHASTTNLVSVAGSQPPPARSGSAMDMRSLTGSPHLQINRSSSAMDHVRPHDRRSPVQRIVSAHVPATGGLYQNSTFGRPNGYGSTYGERSGLTTLENSPTTLGEVNDKYGESGQGGSPWWGSAYEDGSNSRTPTNSAFMHIPENATDSSSGFMSLMDDAPVVPVPSSTYSNTTPALKEVEEDEEDLGLGNNKRSKQPTPTSDENGPAPSQRQEVSQGTSQDTIEAESKPTAAASSWLSKWWKKDSAPGPIKANLGEETAFYYDKDLKRWVNKKAGGEPPKSAAPPPPPNRSQTASPGRSGAYTSPGLPSGPPPPARPASAVDLSSPPRKSAPRARSNLVPDDSMSAPPTPATGAFLGSAQPPPRPRSGASKKPMRSRYVDVFQQPPTPTGTS